MFFSQALNIFLTNNASPLMKIRNISSSPFGLKTTNHMFPLFSLLDSE